MPTLEQAAVILFAAIVLLTGMKLFSIPLRRILRLLLNTALGFVVLAILERFSTYLPFTLGFNLVNAAVIGVLGLPGVGLLVLLKLML